MTMVRRLRETATNIAQKSQAEKESTGRLVSCDDGKAI
jgi:hypothetical protein